MPKSRPLRAECLRRVEEVRNQYRLILPRAVPYEDLLSDDAGELVTPIAPFLTRGDLVEVIDEAGTLYAQLLLIEHVPGRHARFVELVRKELPNEKMDDLKGTGFWRSAWLGWSRLYGVVHPNGSVLRDGIRTRGEAEKEAYDRGGPNFERSTLG